MGTIGIMGALDEEINLYVEKLEGRGQKEHAGFVFYTGKFNGIDAVVVKSGVGKVNASVCAQLMIDKFSISALIHTGVAGALNPSLNISDIVISKQSMHHDMDARPLGFERGRIPFSNMKAFKAADHLVELASSSARDSHLESIEGTMLTGDQFIADPNAVLALRKELGGECVDMESAAVAHTCTLNNVPHVIIRSISDKADFSASSDFAKTCSTAAKNSFMLVGAMASKLALVEKDATSKTAINEKDILAPKLAVKEKDTLASKLAIKENTSASKIYLKGKIRTVPHWPKQGVMFRDITTLLKDREGFAGVLGTLSERYKGEGIDVVVAIESRGFIIGGALAHKLGIGFVPIRKKGKLPSKTVSATYSLEYGTDTIEIHEDAICRGDRVLLVDDLIATGGTALAACELVKKLGGSIIECCFIIDLPELGGRKKLEAANYKVFSLVEFEGE